MCALDNFLNIPMLTQVVGTDVINSVPVEVDRMSRQTRHELVNNLKVLTHGHLKRTFYSTLFSGQEHLRA